jgi:hypothetical protein
MAFTSALPSYAIAHVLPPSGGRLTAMTSRAGISHFNLMTLKWAPFPRNVSYLRLHLVSTFPSLLTVRLVGHLLHTHLPPLSRRAVGRQGELKDLPRLAAAEGALTPLPDSGQKISAGVDKTHTINSGEPTVSQEP